MTVSNMQFKEQTSKVPTPCSSAPAAHDDEQQQQRPSASSTEEAGGGGGTDGAVTIIINPDESLPQEIRKEIDSVSCGGDDDHESRWICRVHPSIREKEGHAYEPKLVSIGPLHHGEDILLPMEATKKRYVRTLLARSPDRSNTLEGYIAAIRGIEDRVRKEYYPEHEIRRFDSDAFAKMLLVDGCFVIEYMLREFFRQRQDESEWGSFHNLERDLMLLENQIPFCVLQQLFDRIIVRGRRTSTTLVEIALHFLGVEADHSEGIMIKANDAHHLLHLSHMCWQLRDVPLTAASRSRHAVVALLFYPIRVAFRLIKQALLCLLFLLLINEWPWSHHDLDLLKKIPCAADLDMSGVKFRRKVLRSRSMEYIEARMTSLWRGVPPSDWTENLGEHISFRRREGVLEIPFVTVGQTLNARLRNFIALEQCHRHLPCHYASYVSFMNSIIYTPADVALLRKYGVIEILFGSDEDVAKMFKSIYEDTNLYKVEIMEEISELSKQVNEYCDVAYHRWRGRLRSSYLRSPWSAIALLVGSAALGLAATQTIFTIRQSYK